MAAGGLAGHFWLAPPFVPGSREKANAGGTSAAAHDASIPNGEGGGDAARVSLEDDALDSTLFREPRRRDVLRLGDAGCPPSALFIDPLAGREASALGTARFTST